MSTETSAKMATDMDLKDIMADLKEQNRHLTLLVANLSAQLAAMNGGNRTGDAGQQTLTGPKKGQPSKVRQQVQTLNARVAASSNSAPSAAVETRIGSKRPARGSLTPTASLQTTTVPTPGVSPDPSFLSNGWTIA